VAQQFVVFIVPTAFAFYLGIGLLTGLEPGASKRLAKVPRVAMALCATAAAVFLALVCFRLVAADASLARIRQALDAGDRSRAVAIWESTKTQRSSGVTADLYFSRRWAAAAEAAQEPLEKVRLAAIAVQAAAYATTVAEQRQSAWYNFAILSAALQRPETVETSLRAAIQTGPRWFKPHWALARLLYSTGRAGEARSEAQAALSLGGGKNTEVIATTAEIIRSPVPQD
jgi:tetratricopeptide (TPR) repeat protein